MVEVNNALLLVRMNHNWQTFKTHTFIRWTGWTLAMTLGHDDSTTHIVMDIIIIITLLLVTAHWNSRYI